MFHLKTHIKICATDTCCSTTPCSSAELFSSTLKLIAAAQCCLTDDFVSDEIKDKDCFDFIIVGGGTSGNVLANRLSEVKGWNVLLLEAGPKPPIFGSIPQLSRNLARTKYDWNYVTENNHRTSQALKTGQVTWVRGKLLGGSSVTNAGFYVKGLKPDYQRWADEGNPSWTPKNIFKYERKAESLQNEALKNNPLIGKNYGSNGQQVLNRYNTTRIPVHNLILDSWDSIGIKQVEDTNSEVYNNRGYCSPAVFTAADGIRYDTYRSYLLPADKRNNLKIVTEAFVSKILVDENKKAYGVEVTINGTKIQLFVSKEVILAAGAVNSPHLLLLSGIGPKNELESKNVSCVVDLPAVGRNLQDHLRIIVPIYGDRSQYDNRNERKCAPENVRLPFWLRDLPTAILAV
ncbi:glucose dehydrogenase [FAD, quinone]-like [Aricia agestis]|uniref:glucose dehydrogenase [FAD, quinone]-like n=1 Tax=Aricia agestis TaxID=91739 RepID=UPI001C2026C9|nr:glucose dehydrogenase [FAD, quinone]-like [Aricia agestis]